MPKAKGLTNMSKFLCFSDYGFYVFYRNRCLAMKSTRASARSLRPKNQPSGSKSSVNNSASKAAPSTSRQKPLDRPGTSNTRLTRSTAPKTAEKRRDQRGMSFN
jgi:hypothetical protein